MCACVCVCVCFAAADADGDGDNDLYVVVMSDPVQVQVLHSFVNLNTRTVTNNGSVYDAVQTVLRTRGSGIATVEVDGEGVLDFPTASGGWLNLRRPVLLRGKSDAEPGVLHCKGGADAWPSTAAIAACGASGGSISMRNIVLKGCPASHGLIHAAASPVLLDRVVVEAPAAAAEAAGRRLSATVAAMPAVGASADGVTTLLQAESGSSMTVKRSTLTSSTAERPSRIVTVVDAYLEVLESTLSCSTTDADAATGSVNGGAVSMVRQSVRSSVVPRLTLTTATVRGCAAAQGGGIYAHLADVVATDSHLIDNNAGVGGGMYGESFASFDLTTVTFDGNSATTRGGAAAMATQSSLQATSTTFARSTAGARGGALDLATDASASLTSSSFVDNSAGTDGGCVAAVAASVTDSGSTFQSCTAHDSGGAVYLDFLPGSSADFVGTTVTGAVAENGDGGAVYWNGQNGVSVLSWQGGRLEGTAPSGRGAGIFTEITHPGAAPALLPNVSADNAGALSTTPVTVAACFSEGAPCCTDSDCGTTVSLEQLNEELTFELRDVFGQLVTAGSTAASCSLVLPSDPSVAVGAGLTSATAGVARFPSTVVAGVVGQTYEVQVQCSIAAFRDVLQSGVFRLLVPSCDPGFEPEPSTRTSCRACSAGFASSTGAECVECPVGRYAVAQSVECQLCPANTYRDQPQGTSVGSCTQCRVVDAFSVTLTPGASSAAHCVCQAGYFKSADNVCVQCDVANGMACNATQEGLTLESLPLQKSYWRVAATSVTVLPCRMDDVCDGGVYHTTADSLCADHHSGPFCELCKDGYSMDETNSCVECTDGNVMVLSTSGVVVLVMAGVALALMIPSAAMQHMQSGRTAPEAPQEVETHERKMRKRSVWRAKGKIAVAFLQVGTVALTEYSIPFPSIVSRVANWFNFLNLNPMGM